MKKEEFLAKTANMSKEDSDIMFTYSYFYPNDTLNINLDEMKFCNHSKNPAAVGGDKLLGQNVDSMYATRDLEAGDEYTEDYEEFNDYQEVPEWFTKTAERYGKQTVFQACKDWQ